ncbi:MAG: hypothetical protein RLZZ142_995 [Verrucomicrobiota bacterium]|jgi:hypothetical protein
MLAVAEKNLRILSSSRLQVVLVAGDKVVDPAKPAHTGQRRRDSSESPGERRKKRHGADVVQQNGIHGTQGGGEIDEKVLLRGGATDWNETVPALWSPPLTAHQGNVVTGAPERRSLLLDNPLNSPNHRRGRVVDERNSHNNWVIFLCLPARKRMRHHPRPL